MRTSWIPPTLLLIGLSSCSEPNCRPGEIKLDDNCITLPKHDGGAGCSGDNCQSDDGGTASLDAAQRDSSQRDATPATSEAGRGEASADASVEDARAWSEPPPDASTPGQPNSPGPITTPPSNDAGMASSDAALMPDAALADAGPKNNCPPNACNPGGMCLSSAEDWSCMCSPAFRGTGQRSCIDHDECKSFENACGSVGGACINMIGTHTCQGVFADWRMPEDGSNTKPSYSGTAEILIDDVTGLQWQNALPKLYDGCTGTRIESGTDVDPGSTCKWDEASSYCSKLRTGGHSDWRLPGVMELMSLVRAAPLSGLDLEAAFWSGTTAVNTRFTLTMMGTMDAALMAGGGGLYVRCVRGLGKHADRPRFTISMDQAEVRDNRTELTWQRKPSTEAFTWTGAKAHCEGQGKRLPTFKELSTLRDVIMAAGTYIGNLPYIDASYFPLTDLVRTRWYWSSTDAAIHLPVPGGILYFTITSPDAYLAYADGEPQSTVRHGAWCVK